MSDELCAGGWSGTLGQRPCAAGALGSVHECLLANLKLNQLTRGGSSIRWVQGSHWCLGAPVIVGRCVSAACVQRSPRGTSQQRGDPWVGKGTRMQARVPAGQKGLADTRGSLKCACVCEPGECCLCACTSDLPPLLPKDCWRQCLVCDTCVTSSGRASVLNVCVLVSLSVCVSVSGISEQHCYWLYLQTGKKPLHPSAWAETPGPQTQLNSWARESPQPEQQEMSILLASLNMAWMLFGKIALLNLCWREFNTLPVLNQCRF